MKYETVLFDLDGTLTDSGEGIVNCVQYALEKMGVPVPSPEALRCFVGPPLFEAMRAFHPQFSEEDARRAVEFYRERYRTTGIYENRVYPGTEDLLCALKENGASLGVASTKPVDFVNEVLRHFHIDGYFDAVSGAEMDGRRSDKAELIRDVLEQMDNTSESALMAGDRFYDAVGAQQAGLDFCGVLYGYGNEEELAAYPHVFLAKDVAALSGFLLG